MASWSLDELQGRMSFEDWNDFFAKLAPTEIGEACTDAMNQQLGVPESLNFYAAGINRLRDMAHLSIALTDDQRDAAIDFSRAVLSYVEERFAKRPDALARLKDALSNSDKYYQRWGTETARQYLFESGIYDEYGAEIKPTED